MTTPEKLIEYSKGLSNEQRLIRYSEEQRSVIESKDSIIDELLRTISEYRQYERITIDRESAFLADITELNRMLTKANDDLTSVRNVRLDIERAKDHKGFYAIGMVGTGFDYVDKNGTPYKNGWIGLNYVGSGFILGASSNPLNNTILYALNVGIKIF